MLSFFLLLTLYGTNSLSLEPMKGANTTADTTDSSGSLLSQLKSDPKKFVAEVSNLDPDDILHIVNLLKALLAESNAREEHLVNDLSTKNTALANADSAMKDASKNLDDLELAVTAAETLLEEKTTAHGVALQEQEGSQKNHDDEVPGLNDEQKILQDVIDILMGLHATSSGSNTGGPGVFGDCENQWCLQEGLSKDQYTSCESISNDGSTCINPTIKYGGVEGGMPFQHGGNRLDLWCEQLGGVYDGEITYVQGDGTCVFGCTSYDVQGEWHWCDCQDGYWFEQSLDSQTRRNYITSITCNES